MSSYEPLVCSLVTAYIIMSVLKENLIIKKEARVLWDEG